MSVNYIKSDIKLTIGILVSNRIKYIRRVMEALQPLLKAVPSELIAVDTKGAEGDGSIDIVKEYTDKIYPFIWCNDFSAARNVCLEHACGEWFMYLDDDEVFDDVQELIDFFQSGEYKNYGAGYYGVMNHKADGSETMAVVGRMVRRTKDTRFVGKVHEHFNQVFEPFKSFSCYVHHYGYFFENDAASAAHQKRNVTLLLEEIEGNGYTPRMCAQLMQELLSREETAQEGFRFFEGCIDKITENYGMEDSCTQWMLVASVRYFNIRKDYKGLLKQAKKIKEIYGLSQVAQLALAGVVIAASAPEGNVGVILEYAPMYYRAWNWLKTHEKEAVSQKQLDFPKYITQDYAVQVFQAAATCANAVKEYKAAYAYWEQLPWNDPAFDGSRYATAMQETLDGLEKAAKEPETKEAPVLIKSDIKLTIGMLVSNHIEMIRKCMESIKPLLDAVSSELIVLDTKGEETDGSIAIVREYTDKIYRFEWCNDFSAARNALLDHASGEWFLYFDDDEYFDDVQEFIDFFRSGECEKYYAGFYYTRDYDAKGKYSTSIAGRMIRRTTATRFVGKIHETFNEVYAPNKQFQCFTHHYGYAFSNEETRKAHQERNLSILRTELKEQGYAPRVCAQLVQELLSQEETAAEGYRFAMEVLPKFAKEELKDSLVQWIMVATVRYFSTRNAHKQVLEQARLIEENFELGQIADLVLSVVVTLSAILNDDAVTVQKYVERYMMAWEWSKAHPEETLLQMQLDFPEYMDEKYYQHMKRAGKATEEYFRNNRQENVKKMKRLSREEMLSVPATLKKANLLTTAPGISAGQLTDILTKCQKSAITLGEALERYGEAGGAIIRMLEEYCEALYLQSQNFGNESVLKEFQSGIDALLNLVEQEIEKLPPDKKVVVFLPYKASMWDSLESVWKAADEDSDCEAYVVPIPYYDRNPDRSFGEMHYEGDEYPSYVPITSWEEFSIPDMKPDAIYIHNPYDELNFVTSVHPMFYAANLKNYTKELVYIPYFVLDDRNLKDPEVLKHVEQYCMQPGVIHAHKVVVQSEAMKEAYVTILTQKFGEETRVNWEAKILGLGSPKFDKINSIAEADYEIPEEWKSVLYKPNGSRKKVILYNTSVGALVNNNEKMIDKMRNVFRVFYENRDEVALLWRPHPLIKSTIESMRPSLWGEYEKLVNEYRNASWGIYDDTADLHRAIALADAYYGDASSLVQLCQEKGIPCMVQDVEK